MIDLSTLPKPKIVEELSFEAIFAERKTRLLELTPESQRDEMKATLARESEPVTKLLQENAYRELLLRQHSNEAVLAVLIAFAGGDDLDAAASNNGVKRLTLADGSKENDTDLRIRAMSAYEGMSVAGPTGAYEYHARSADGRVADVKAESPEPCDVVVTVLSKEGNGTASDEVLNIVRKALSAEDVIPCADRVTVQSAKIVDYRINATLFMYPGPEQEPVLQAAQASIEKYVQEQRRLGRDIRRSAVIGALHVTGVQHCDLIEPAQDIVLDNNQASHCIGIAITNGGTDE